MQNLDPLGNLTFFFRCHVKVGWTYRDMVNIKSWLLPKWKRIIRISREEQVLCAYGSRHWSKYIITYYVVFISTLEVNITILTFHTRK